ncbi:hypothetical protein Fot_55757 [Forsythia ovata]|uniref:RNA cytidine acetyltransferase n=1 Tax=Forsythia ovata TaxID=205694 RepID=A0ABD1P347_9LAMI
MEKAGNMVKVDDRITSLIECGVKARHRSMFMIKGDKSLLRRVVDLHSMLSKASIKSRPTVLWCYKDKLEFSSNEDKRARQFKKRKLEKLLAPDMVDQISLFIDSAKYCRYKDSARILGNTYGMCILQDFEDLTPNVLARTIETVEGGGLVILLLHSLSPTAGFITMAEGVNESFTAQSSMVVSRFNKRFVQSLSSCKACLVVDERLKILPVSSHAKSMIVSSDAKDMGQQLSEMKEEFVDDFPVGPLIGLCATLDQGNAVRTLLHAVMGKALQNNTIALTASRGQGKSAALGLAIAGAIDQGKYTQLTNENVDEDLALDIDAVLFSENFHYDVLRNQDSQKEIIKINVYKQNKQTVQYIKPCDDLKLSRVDLLVIDEAAAIPLIAIKSLLGPYLVFLSSTVSGYEGTGCSLLLELLRHLEKKNQVPASGNNDIQSASHFKTLELHESIRYACGDPIESWLNDLLCLEATNCTREINRLPHPSMCQLYYVTRDTLFSFCKDSEIFLKRMMSLFVASQYQNSSNDLQLLADDPACHLFVLLGPVESLDILPDIYCVIQVCLEGQISQDTALQYLSRGRESHGDQIRTKFCKEFKDTTFPTLSGVRVVRIAVHPSALGLGYGSAALQELTRYYEGQLTHISETDSETYNEDEEKDLLINVRYRPPEKIHYIGAFFGLSLGLFRFWKKQEFSPFYIDATPNKLTGEHSCMVLKPVETDEIEGNQVGSTDYLSPFYLSFKERFVGRLASCFREMDYKLAMSILDPKIKFSGDEPLVSCESNSMLMKLTISSDTLELLEGYTRGCDDYGKVMYLVQHLALWYFQEKLPITLSYIQASILLSMGLQHHDIACIEEKMETKRQQLLSLFRKVVVKFHKYLYVVLTNEFYSSPSKEPEIELRPHSILLDDDLNDGAKQVMVSVS